MVIEKFRFAEQNWPPQILLTPVETQGTTSDRKTSCSGDISYSKNESIYVCSFSIRTKRWRVSDRSVCIPKQVLMVRVREKPNIRVKSEGFTINVIWEATE
jgi:hypothetical protein